MTSAMQHFENKRAFIKELTFRSANRAGIDQHYRDFEKLKKDYRESERNAKEAEGIVEQEPLRLSSKPQILGGGGRNVIEIRPILGRGKENKFGSVSIHENGVRFTSASRERCDITFDNIKHMLLQKCDKQSGNTILHFRLKHPILVKKKKTSDVSFMTEVISASEALDKTRSRYHRDQDGLEEEQRERKMRKNLNKAYSRFAQCIMDNSKALDDKYHVQLEVPYPDAGFMGCPFKEMVRLQPTNSSLMNVTGNKAFVISIADIEHVHFVCPSAKNFDLVFFMKGLNEVHVVSAVEVKAMQTIFEWLQKCDITSTSGNAAMRWVGGDKSVCEIVKKTPIEEFWSDVGSDGLKKPIGWNFLSAAPSDNEEEEEEESEFEVDDDEEFDDDDDDFDSDDFASESGLDDEAYSGSDDEEGWSDMEAEAMEEDRKRERQERMRGSARASKRTRRR
jgi:nucleosome binding factor SPN SPT16 subunit